MPWVLDTPFPRTIQATSARGAVISEGRMVNEIHANWWRPQGSTNNDTANFSLTVFLEEVNRYGPGPDEYDVVWREQRSYSWDDVKPYIIDARYDEVLPGVPLEPTDNPYMATKRRLFHLIHSKGHIPDGTVT